MPFCTIFPIFCFSVKLKFSTRMICSELVLGRKRTINPFCTCEKILTYLLAVNRCCAEEYQEVAGSLAALFLGLGLALGSVTSYLTIQLL